MDKITVLDHGHVGLFESMGSDLSIVRNARVSYDAEWRAGEDEDKDEKLLRYLLKNRHTSPFESVTFTFDIKCPIFIARQWHRHRTWSFNEVSARYSQLPSEYYIPAADKIGRQAKHNKQMREMQELPEYGEMEMGFIEDLQRHSELGYELYEYHLKSGIPRELARCFLSLNIYTHFFGTVDLHNLMHFLRLRLHSHAQYEIQVYGVAILELIRNVVPVTVKIFEDMKLLKC